MYYRSESEDKCGDDNRQDIIEDPNCPVSRRDQRDDDNGYREDEGEAKICEAAKLL